MGAMRALGLVILLTLSSVPSSIGAQSGAFSFTGSGWKSFYASASGESIWLNVSGVSERSHVFGVDLYAANGTLVLAVRGSGVDSFLAEAQVQTEEFDLSTRRDGIVISSGGGAVGSISGGDIRCHGASIQISLIEPRFAFRLDGCEGLDRIAKGAAFGVGDALGAFEWRIETSGSFTHSPHASGVGGWMLGLDDLEGPGAHVHVPGVDVIHAPQQQVSLYSDHGFLGSYFIWRYEEVGQVEHGYSSPTTVEDCPCVLSESVPGKRTFTINGTSVSRGSLFILGGVDASMPP